MLTARVCTTGEIKEIDPVDVSRTTGDPDRVVWVDVVDPDEADLTCVQEEFDLHPLAMEDIRERHQRAKLEHYPSHSFIVAYSGGLQEVNLFVGPSWVVTVRESDDAGQPWPLDGVLARYGRARPEHGMVGFLLYVILDELVDGYFVATDAMEDSLEDLEERVFADELPEERSIQQELFGSRRRLMLFRRAVVPLRDVVASLMRREVDWVDQTTATHLQDVFDHVLRAIDQLDAQRELLGNAAEAHLAVVSNRMNAVMKRMTSGGAILLGATLVAGIYGMNFEHMPELGWAFGYPFALGVMVAISIAGFTWFKRKGWL